MSRSSARTNGQTRFRRSHRWVGTVLVAFVLYLAVTGILLNHSSDVGLDRQYIGWSWLLEAYGMGELRGRLDQALVPHPPDGVVQRSGLNLHALTGALLHLLQDAVPVPVMVGEGEQDVIRQGCQRENVGGIGHVTSSIAGTTTEIATTV